MGRRSKFVRIFSVIALVTVIVLFAALIINSFQNGGKPLTTLSPQGPDSDSIQRLLIPVTAIAAVVFLIIELAALVISWKFRERKGDETDEFPSQTHGNTVLEIGWTILPALILAGIAVATVMTLIDLNRKPTDAISIRVEGQQWWWQYKYDLNGDGEFDGIGDITTATEMVIPAGRPIQLTVTSNDVIHSFWIPALNGKRDAVPGMTSPWKLQADEPGVYRGQCTEFCGLSHANMRMLVRALPADQYDAWVKNQLKTHGETPTDPTAAAGKAV
jgi:cytochrome c oxidase subunit II